MGDEQGEGPMAPGENPAEQEPVTRAELSALIQGAVKSVGVLSTPCRW